MFRIIAHRGASGLRPEHTLAAYELAIQAGVDAIELDLVPTGDGSLIARHDNELSITTDVAQRAEFATRRRSKNVDGVAQIGWFSEDFTIDEIRALRARQRFDFRSRAFDGALSVPSLDDVLQMVRKSVAPDRAFRVYLELKHPTYFASIGLPFEQTLPPILRAAGFQPEFLPDGLKTRALKNASSKFVSNRLSPKFCGRSAVARRRSFASSSMIHPAIGLRPI